MEALHPELECRLYPGAQLLPNLVTRELIRELVKVLILCMKLRHSDSPGLAAPTPNDSVPETLYNRGHSRRGDKY